MKASGERLWLVVLTYCNSAAIIYLGWVLAHQVR